MNQNGYEQESRKSFEHHPLLSPDGLKLLDHVTDKVFFWVDMVRGNCRYMSRSAPSVIGYSTEVLKKEGLTFFASKVHPEDYKTTLRNYAKTLVEIRSLVASDRHSYAKSAEFRIKNGRGHWMWIEVNFVLLKCDQSQSMGNVLGTIKDITSIKSGNQFLWFSLDDNLDSKEDLDDLLKSVNKNGKRSKSINGWHNSNGGMLEIGLQKQPAQNITAREKEVLQMIAQGYLSKQVADKLCISTYTVTNHRKHLIAKFNVKNTAELIKEASKLFWL